jgi:hypothetical protein
MSALVSVRSLVWSAFLCGSLRGFVSRPSAHSFSGRVVVAAFASPASASRFARRWAGRLGVSVFVRPARSRSGARLWAVSVPVASPASASPLALPVAGGLRGLVAVLGAAGV